MNGIERRHPDERPRRAAVLGLVQPDARLRESGRLRLPAAHAGHAQHRGRRRHVDRLRVARLDDDGADAAREGEVHRDGRDRRIDDHRRHARPGVAAIDRSVESRAGAGVVRLVGLAGADEDRVAAADRSDRAPGCRCCWCRAPARSTATPDRPGASRRRSARRRRQPCRPRAGTGPSSSQVGEIASAETRPETFSVLPEFGFWMLVSGPSEVHTASIAVRPRNAMPRNAQYFSSPARNSAGCRTVAG